MIKSEKYKDDDDERTESRRESGIETTHTMKYYTAHTRHKIHWTRVREGKGSGYNNNDNELCARTHVSLFFSPFHFWLYIGCRFFSYKMCLLNNKKTTKNTWIGHWSFFVPYDHKWRTWITTFPTWYEASFGENIK